MRHKMISIIKFSQLFALSNEKIAVLMTLQSSLGLLLHALWTYHISSFVSIVLSYPSNVCTRICVHVCVCGCMYVFAGYRSATFTCEKCETVESVCRVSMSSLVLLVYQYVGWLFRWENHLIKYLQEGVTVVEIAFEMALCASCS